MTNIGTLKLTSVSIALFASACASCVPTTVLSTTPPALDRFMDGAMQGLGETFAPGTGLIFFGVLTLGPIALQAAWGPVRRSAEWLVHRAMPALYLGGLAMATGEIGYGLGSEAAEHVGQGCVLGALLVGTKCLGDQVMPSVFDRLGHWLLRRAQDSASLLARTARRIGAAMTMTAGDRAATSGLVLCSHSFDEIAAFTVAVHTVLQWVQH